ncbi:nucleolar protein 14 [Trichonephila clavata]|uniref:Nucleolar protein 14 n=1 Tax=Trichonephila clavata TaxID=2740835 RepID=A0A8X6FYI6_TRICU|nr:nucleolar protein 14 [Trichonephila clavata]
MVKQVFKKNKNFKGEGNPFNLKLNREKHTVLGKKPRGTKGLRCISRAQSHMKRKELYNKRVPFAFSKDLDEVPGSDDDEQLDAAFVSKAHFGGFSAKDQENLSHKRID